MVFKFFNDNQIVAPLKCGTRYLEKVFGEPSLECSSQQFKGTLIYPNLKTIVIREPFEHLSSAIHTEILGFLKDDKTKDIREKLRQFTTINPKNHQSTHWDRYFYADIYWYWRRNQNHTNIDVIDLKDLSPYLKKNYLEQLPIYDSTEFDFHKNEYYCHKKDLMLFIKLNYQQEWDNLMKQIKVSNMFYKRLIDREIVDIRLF